MTPTGERMIAHFEGMVLSVYLDSHGNPTAGMGHLLSKSEQVQYPVGTPISREKAAEWFEQDAQWVDAAIARRVSIYLNENQRAALESLVFNCGAGILTGRAPKLVAALNAGHFSTAAREFLDICNAVDAKTGKRVRDNGLAKRRKEESELFLRPVA